MTNRPTTRVMAPTIIITPQGIHNKRDLSSRMAGTIRELVKAYRLVVIDLRAQSFGLYLGHLWFIIEPALQAGAYYFLLRVVFRMEGADSTFAFFFIGITFWRSHAALITSSPYFLISKGYPYIEQGLGLLSAVLETLVSEILLLVARCAVLIVFLSTIGITPRWIWMLVPVVVVCQFLFSMALFLIVSVVGARYKDVGRLISHVVWLWWYLSPGLYSLGRIPDWAIIIYRANPFAYLIPSYHEMILQGSWSGTNVIGCVTIAAASVMALSLAYPLMYRFSYKLVHHV